jgi:hypothetical protein
MLPSGNADAHGPLVLLAHVGDRAEHDEGYLRMALAVAKVPGHPAPVLVCCSVASAIEKALVLRPHLVVIGESFVPEWHDLQLALCHRLKQQASAETAPAVVLLRDPRICGELLPDGPAAADVVSMLDRQAVLSSLRYGLYGC